MTKIRLLLLKDRRPGHFRKTDGAVAAIARHHEVEAEDLWLKPPRLIPGRYLQRLAATNVPPGPVLRALWGIRVDEMQRPDLIISAGAETLPANIFLSRHFGVPNIFIGSLRRVPPESFSLILHAYPEGRFLPRHIFVLAPSVIDADRLRKPEPLVSGVEGRTIALLVGGPAPGYAYEATDWTALDAVVRGTAGLGLNWWITSSRRTPDAVADSLQRLADAVPDRVRFTDYRKEKAGSADALFNADAIAVTEDSNTMIAESVASQRPVVVLRPSRRTEEAPSLPPLVESRRVALLPLAEAGPERLLAALATVKPLEVNPLDTLYRQMADAGVIRDAR